MAFLSVIRRWALRDHLSIRAIAQRTGLSRNTIRKYRNRAMHLTQVLSIGSGSPAAQDFFRRDRAEIDGLLHQPQEQQAARS